MRYSDNVFYRLFTYRPRTGRSAEEDFLTEAYAAVLLSDRRAASGVLSELCGVAFSPDFSLLTQTQNGADRPDMEFRDNCCDVVVYQENKVGSAFEETQIPRYQNLASRAKELNRRVVSCTLAGADCPSMDTSGGVPPVIHITWTQIYETIERFIPGENNPARTLWVDFLDFLESKGMKPFKALNPSAIEALREVESTRNQLLQFVDTMGLHIESRVSVARHAFKKSPNSYVVEACEFIVNGVLIRPRFEMNSAAIFATLVIWSSEEGSVRAKLSDILQPFADIGWGIEARQNIAELCDHRLLDSDAASQTSALFGWLDGTLERLIDSELITRR